ncbi:MAG: hypothetical protein RLY93_03380 [Sumerlaeia bacterium]
MNPVSSTTPVQAIGRYDTSQPITAVSMDGNTVAAAVVSLDQDGTPRIHAVKIYEHRRLLQKIQRVVHPIFMDISALEYGSEEEVADALGHVLGEPAFHHPLVGVFPHEMVMHVHSRGGDFSSGEVKLFESTAKFLEGVLPGAPPNYPRLLSYGNDHGRRGYPGWLWSANLDDLLDTMDCFVRNPIQEPLFGVITSDRAMAEVYPWIVPETTDRIVTLADVGKLRTIYCSSLTPSPMHAWQNLYCHTIPVGLARDGAYYYGTFLPIMEDLEDLSHQSGTLLFPPDVTPSPIFNPTISTPQTDCTRFAMQVSRYAWRLIESSGFGESAPDSIWIYLTGLARHLPGLARYVEGKTGVTVRTLEEASETSRLRLDEGVTWRSVADALPAVGAGIAFHRRGTSRYGAFLRDMPLRRLGSVPIGTAFETPAAYIVDQPLESLEEA